MIRKLLRYLLRVTAPQRSGLALWDLVEIALVAFGFLAYFLVRGAVVDRTGDALAHARDIVALQEALGVWVEPQVNAWVLEHRVVIRVLNFAYFWFDFPLIVGVGLLLFWRRRACYTLLRDSVLISGALALILYWSFPVAPPRYLTEWGFVDTLEQYSNLSYQAQSMRPFVNPFAAVPSLHVGWAALLAVAVFVATENWLVRAASIVSFLVQAVAVIGTANHYLLDGVVGLVVCAVGLAIAVALQRRGYPGIRALIAWMERTLARRRGQSPAAGV
ncbi:MAG: phosphatase PAP2 family protein [Dehalococcoidia bacterium]